MFVRPLLPFSPSASAAWGSTLMLQGCSAWSYSRANLAREAVAVAAGLGCCSCLHCRHLCMHKEGMHLARPDCALWTDFLCTCVWQALFVPTVSKHELLNGKQGICRCICQVPHCSLPPPPPPPPPPRCPFLSQGPPSFTAAQACRGPLY